MTSRFMVVPAAYVFLLRPPASGPSQQVLLQLRDGTGYMDGYWAAAVAGHVEKGESVFEAAAREAAEEIGVHDVELTALCAMHRTGRGAAIDERVDYFFASTGWSGEPRIVEPDKCADLRWFALDDLPDPVVPHELSVLEAVRAGHVEPIVAHGFAAMRRQEDDLHTQEDDGDMTATGRMLEAYPRDLGDVDKLKLAACIEACFECAQVCTACADACLSEKMVADLATCIRSNLDCADVCSTTGRVLSRHTGYDAHVTRAVLETCVLACRTCGDTCAEHATMHEHCRECAESCRTCEQACRELIGSLG